MSSNHHQPYGHRTHKPSPRCNCACGQSARSGGCIKKSRTKCENTAIPAANATARPRRRNRSRNSTAQKIDAASECDQSMKSSENPGARPGVSDARSKPRSTKIPNSTSRNPTPSSRAQVGARGCAVFRASAAAKWPAYIRAPRADDRATPGWARAGGTRRGRKWRIRPGSSAPPLGGAYDPRIRTLRLPDDGMIRRTME